MTVLDLMIAGKGLSKYAAGNSAIIVYGVGDNRERRAGGVVPISSPPARALARYKRGTWS